MPTEKKVNIVDGLQEAFTRCSIGILTDYRGLTTTELSALRRKMTEAGVEYRVVKNSLAQIACRNVGREDIADLFSGPVAVALGYGEVPDTAKALTEYISVNKSTLEVKSGFFGDTVLTSKEIESLAKLPTREVLIAQVIGGMQSPITGLVNVLAGPIRNVMGALRARITQLEAQ
ncbi:MAG: 50S ribosomal protein L10 [Dehalococcoidia bacterium]|jgi:large subunit ribosomal protein L10